MRDALPCRRVLVVEDHLVLAELIAQTLGEEAGVECVAIADDVAPALVTAVELRPDAIVIDANLPSGDGVALLPELHGIVPGVRSVVLTARPRPDRERAALGAGAVGYLGKDGSLAALLDALRFADSARPARDPRMIARSAEAITDRALSPREGEVLALLAEGHHVQDIAGELCLSVHTARGYVKSVLGKLGARSQLEAVATAAREGLVRVG